MKILIIEDDEQIISFLKKGLEEESYIVDYSLNGDEGIYLASVNNYDLILLDIMIPIKNGIEVCKILRNNNIQVPIIMLTALDDVDKKVDSLDNGANDYIVKPFSLAELLARIRVQLRQTNKNDTILEISGLKLDLLSKTAKRDNKEITLTSKEFVILELLMKNKNRILSESIILDALTNLENINMSNIVNVYIYRLRNKIDKPFKKKYINTVRGLGYKINDN
jgi:DNA-binding response OmpR family regulator